jgi:hypothetical protein
MKENVYSFKITPKQQILLLGPTFYFWLGLVLVIKLIYKQEINSIGFLIVAIFFFLIDTLPSLIVFIQYWLTNKNAVLTIDTSKKELQYNSLTKNLKYTFEEIDKLQYYRTYGKGSGWNSFGMYRYYKIIFKDQTVLFITCLMMNNIENTLEILLHKTADKNFKLICLAR